MCAFFTHLGPHFYLNVKCLFFKVLLYTTCTSDKSSCASSCTTLLLLFLTFSVLVANPKKLLYTVANPARGLLNREKRTKEKVWQHTPPPTPHTARSEKINKITRRIYRRYAGGRSRVRTRIPSARRLGLWVWLRNSTLPLSCCCFSHSAHWLPTRKKQLYTVANPARGLLNREKKKKKKSGSAPPPPPPPRALLVRRKNKNATH